jgi:hypothetical protein
VSARLAVKPPKPSLHRIEPALRLIGVDSTEMFATLVLRASCHGHAFARAAR